MKKSDNDSQDSANSQTFADRLEDRLIDFAVRIIRLVARMPKTPAGKHVSGQILRSGTSSTQLWRGSRSREQSRFYSQDGRGA
jgi:hypothetical protein